MRIVAMEPYTVVHSKSRIRSSRARHLARLRTTYTKVDFRNASRYVKILKHPYLCPVKSLHAVCQGMFLFHAHLRSA